MEFRGHVADAPGEHQDHDREHHGLESGDPGADRGAEREDPAGHREHDARHATGDRGPEQGDVRIRVRHDLAEAVGRDSFGGEGARARQPDRDSRGDEDGQDGKHASHPESGRNPFYPRVLVERLGGRLGARTKRLIEAPRPLLGDPHRAEIPPQEPDREREGKREDGIEPVRDGPQEHRVPVLRIVDQFEPLVDQAHFVADPGGDDDGARHRGRSGIGQECQFLAGDPQTVGDGPHQVAADDHVRVVVEKDDERGHHGAHLAAPRSAGEARDELGETPRPATPREDPGEAAEHHAENDDVGAVAVGDRADDVAAAHLEESGERIEVEEQGAPDPDARYQGEDHLTEEDREQDREHGWCERPDARDGSGSRGSPRGAVRRRDLEPPAVLDPDVRKDDGAVAPARR